MPAASPSVSPSPAHPTNSTEATPASDLATASRAFARRLTRIGRYRRIGIVGVVLSVLAILVGAYKARTLVVGDRLSVSVGSACVAFGVHRPLPADWNATVSRPLIPGSGLPIGIFNYYIALDGGAWRPYHAAGWSAHHAVFPLWQPLLVCGLMAGLSHGYLRGLRWRDPQVCIGCGHSIVPLPGMRACPECGLSQTTSDMPRAA